MLYKQPIKSLLNCNSKFILRDTAEGSLTHDKQPDNNQDLPDCTIPAEKNTRYRVKFYLFLLFLILFVFLNYFGYRVGIIHNMFAML